MSAASTTASAGSKYTPAFMAHFQTGGDIPSQQQQQASRPFADDGEFDSGTVRVVPTAKQAIATPLDAAVRLSTCSVCL